MTKWGIIVGYTSGDRRSIITVSSSGMVQPIFAHNIVNGAYEGSTVVPYNSHPYFGNNLTSSYLDFSLAVPQAFQGVKVFTYNAEPITCNLYGVNNGVETLLKSNFNFGTKTGTTHSFINTTAFKSYRFRPNGGTQPAT